MRHKYSMSFTSGTLLHRESVVVAELFAELNDWDAVRDRIVAENLLQMRTENASRRITREVTSRLKTLTADELTLFCEGSRDELRLLLWLAVCKRYRFVYDFATEVLREKFLRLDMTLTQEEYDVFFSKKAEWHPEVEGIASATQAKQRQVVFKMLREADLLLDDGRIQPAILTPRLIETIQADDPAHFAIYPVSEYDIKVWSNADATA